MSHGLVLPTLALPKPQTFFRNRRRIAPDINATAFHPPRVSLVLDFNNAIFARMFTVEWTEAHRQDIFSILTLKLRRKVTAEVYIV